MKKLLVGLFVLCSLAVGSQQAHASVLSDALLKIKSLTSELAKLQLSLGAFVADAPVFDEGGEPSGGLPSGSMTASPSSFCEISSGNSSCNLTLDWKVYNVPATYNVEIIRLNDHVVFSTAISGPRVVSVNYVDPIAGGEIYSLYYKKPYENMLNVLKEIPLHAYCTQGTLWSSKSGKCLTSVITPPAGLISASSCIIHTGDHSCYTNLEWKVVNAPEGNYSIINTTTRSESVSSFGSRLVENSGIENQEIHYGDLVTFSLLSGSNPPDIFGMFYNAISLGSVSVTATCITGTSWDPDSKVCQDTTVTISEIQGPQKLNVNQQGLWTITASDSLGKNLRYSVNWGDTAPSPLSLKSGIKITQYTQQTAIFTHTYTKPGTYYAMFTVTNNSEQSATAGLMVTVGDGSPLISGCLSNVGYSTTTGQSCSVASVE